MTDRYFGAHRGDIDFLDTGYRADNAVGYMSHLCARLADTKPHKINTFRHFVKLFAEMPFTITREFQSHSGSKLDDS